jgi:hypothetical protein
MGVVKWNTLSINIYSQLDNMCTPLIKKDNGVVKCDMEPNGTCTTIHFGKENITCMCLQVVGKSHINR